MAHGRASAADGHYSEKDLKKNCHFQLFSTRERREVRRPWLPRREEVPLDCIRESHTSTTLPATRTTPSCIRRSSHSSPACRSLARVSVSSPEKKKVIFQYNFRNFVRLRCSAFHATPYNRFFVDEQRQRGRGNEFRRSQQRCPQR